MKWMIAKSTFLLRQENGEDVIAKRGERIQVTNEELKKLRNKFIEVPVEVKKNNRAK